MNPKEVNAKKKVVVNNKSSFKHGVQQIFVLPPNLLQKLGINLGNIQSTSTHHYQELDHSISSSSKPTVRNSNNDSSFVKTASLMKQSVFLSPTFNTPGIGPSVNSPTHQAVEECNANINKVTENTDKLEATILTTPNKIVREKECYSKLIKNKNQSRGDEGLSIDNNNLQVFCESVDSNKANLSKETKNTINIISEETITINKLKELQALKSISMKESMVSASLNTLIVKKTKNNSDLQSPIFSENIAEKGDKPEGDFNSLVSENESENLVVPKIGSRFDQEKQIEICQSKNNTFKVNNEIYNSNISIQDTHENDSENHKQISKDNINTDLLVKHHDLNELEINDVTQNEEDEHIISMKNLTSIGRTNSIINNIEPCEKKFGKTSKTYVKKVDKNHSKSLDEASQGLKSITVLTDSHDQIETKSADNINNNNLNIDEPSHEIMKSILPNYKVDNELQKIETNKDIDEPPLESPKHKKNLKDTIQSKAEISSMFSDNVNNNFTYAGLSENLGATFKMNIDHDSRDKVEGCTEFITGEDKKLLRAPENSIQTKNNGSIVGTDIQNALFIPTCMGSQEKKSTIIEQDNSILKMTLNPERNELVSKLCIQGVEKPGGEEEGQDQKSPKKYRNRKNKSFSVKNVTNLKKLEFGFTDLHQKNYPVFLSNVQQFCICKDFGILPYDDTYDNDYEHIHFLGKKSTDCSSDLIFSIYDDEMFRYKEHTKTNMHFKDTGDEKMSIDCICWNHLDFIQNDANFNSENNKDNAYTINSNGKMQEANITTFNAKNCCPIEIINSCEGDMQLDGKNNVYNNDIPKLYNGNDTNVLSRKRKLSIEYSDEATDFKKINSPGPGKTPGKEQDSEHGKDSLEDSVQEKRTKRAISDKSVICGVCKQKMRHTEWSAHMASHNYIAWKKGEKPFDIADYNELRKHLNRIVNDVGVLICAKCGFENRYAKGFVRHLKTCCNDISNTTADQPQVSVEKTSADDTRIMRCGVCKEEMPPEQWIEHIRQQHEYKAWEDNEPSVDFNDEELLRSHLYNIVKKYGALQCAKCGKSRKYVKLYLQHINSCSWQDQNETLNISYEDTDSILDIPSVTDSVVDNTSIVQCGVCLSEIEAQGWLDHIQKEHNYLSWQVGRKPLNLKDEEFVRRYLYNVVQKLGALVCGKCGKARKYVKMYLQHIESCTGPSDLGVSGNESNLSVTNSMAPKRSRSSTQEDKILSVDMNSATETSPILNNSIIDTSNVVNDGQDGCLVKCGECKQEVDSVLWIQHIQQEHSYAAWQEGKTPLNITDKDEVKQHLEHILHEVGQLLCARCNMACKSVKLYLQHMEACDGNIIIKCGVCNKEMKESSWLKHISINHEYIAWKETETPLDLNDYEAIWQHLMGIIKEEGHLRCVECGVTRKYPKAYLLHIKDCYGKTYTFNDSGNNSSNASQATDMDTTLDSSRVSEYVANETGLVKCGVCAEEMEARLWLDHIHKTHNYLAWQEGATPIDLNNETSIKNHLQNVERQYGRLTCPKCGFIKKKFLLFHRHMKSCDGTEPGQDSLSKWEIRSTGATVKCGVCHAEMNDSEWIAHIAKDHSYLAWREGEEPIGRDDETACKNHLNRIIQHIGELTCSLCGLNRRYARSFLHHLRACIGNEESKRDSNEAPPKELTGVIVKCGVCKRQVDDSIWFEHIKGHNYVAWKDNETPLVLDTEELVREHLYNIVEKTGKLICKKCGLVRKYVKSFLQHIEGCQGITWKTLFKIKKEKGDIVRCGVCQLQMDDTEWLDHIAQCHNYLAWRDRDPPINLEDESEVRNHLKMIIQEEGFLQCAKCGVQRKYPKKYLEHLKECDGLVIDDVDESQNEITIFEEIDLDTDVKIVKCGVCQQQVLKAKWIEHIQMEHKYIAWIDGTTPVDINDKEKVYNHLYAISNKYNGLVCSNCGLNRKYVKSYLSHVNSCIERINYDKSEEMIECGVCGGTMKGKSWRHHALQQHYNVAWVAGDLPIDIKNYSEVEKCLKDYCEYKQKMKCHTCGITRSSYPGFYAHILTCGKTEEEKENFKEVCDICNQKYLCIYKSQHYAGHKAQELAKERKMKAEQKPIKEEETDDNNSSGRRRAAEKARSVIGDYAAKLSAGSKCESCGQESDGKKDPAEHFCDGNSNKYNDDEDSDVSIQMEDYAQSDSDDNESSSDASNDEDTISCATPGKRKRNRHGAKYPSKLSRMPYTVKDIKSYLQEATEDYFNLFYTSEKLFPQWKDCTYEEVPKDLLSQYMPPLEESCKLRVGKDGWSVLKRFEAKEDSYYCTMFTGGCVQCMSWAPALEAGGAGSAALLGVACHRAADVPRLRAADTPEHPALVQMWDFNTFDQPPKLAYGLAHDYGVVWSLDWCPSGAREELEPATEGGKRSRLGLMAMACSNGSAYIVPVPNPEDKQNGDIPFYKIKPCVELRLNRGAIKYQATSIHWVLEKEYTTIIVGYGDGTTALYDLVTESPLLKTTEGDVTILYPFKDERAHNSCITGLTSNLQGALCSFSPTGATGAAGPAGGARPLRAHTALAASAGVFTPHWPSVLLSGDDTIVGHSLSELEWGQAGRRVGAVRAAAGGGRGARVAAAVPPLLLTMRPHPVHSQGHRTLHKKAIAMIDIKSLAKKRSKHINDELSMKLEPLTYEDAIKLYGIEFNIDKDMNKLLVQKHMSKQQEPCPERFPLADVVALAYCPEPRHYKKLAVATHAGLIFLMDV